MAKNGYVSVDGKARKIGKYFVGDENGVARKVTKAYIGDENGKARLCYVAHVHNYAIVTYQKIDSSQHKTTLACDCGSYMYRYDDHTCIDDYSKVSSYNASGHKYKSKCACGYSRDSNTYTHVNKTYVLEYSTCSSKGKNKVACQTCDYFYEQDRALDPYNHGNYTSKITTQATCTQTGVRTYTCGCGKHSYTETIERAAHRYGPDGKCMYCGFGSVSG